MAKSPRIFHLLQQSYLALFRAVDGVLKANEGILTAHQVILFVLTHEDGLPSAEVAKRAGMSRSRLTALLDALESRELVRREKLIDDRRVQRIFITDQGAGIIQRTASKTRSLNADMLAPFDAQQQDTIIRFLHHVSHIAEAVRLGKK